MAEPSPVTSEWLVDRRAIEALRSGVPNGDAVRVLGCDQVHVIEAFESQLEAVDTDDAARAGLLVAGGFGTGKSHLLKFLEELALAQNFVTSHVVISKETPLYDRGKVFRSAVENARVPGRTGMAIQEIALSLRQDSPRYADLYRWANSPASGMAALLPATLLLHERLNNDPELVEEIRNFWAGDRIAITRIRDGLRQIKESSAFSLKAVRVRDLAEMRFPFTARLVHAGGYRGWVILIDEVELVGRYSLLQRARSYAELAWWMGVTEAGRTPGLLSVAAVTDDFKPVVLDEKGDRDYVGPKLRDRGTDEDMALAAKAEAGMRTLERDAVFLERPTSETLSNTHARLRDIHAAAYEWDPPDLGVTDVSITRPIRLHVRRWINEWDLHRLYPDAQLETEEAELRPTYEEDLALESAEEPVVQEDAS